MRPPWFVCDLVLDHESSGKLFKYFSAGIRGEVKVIRPYLHSKSCPPSPPPEQFRDRTEAVDLGLRLVGHSIRVSKR